MATYSKTIVDKFANEISVASEDDSVSVFTQEGAVLSDFLFTPRQARRLAKALKRAAKIAERPDPALCASPGGVCRGGCA